VFSVNPDKGFRSVDWSGRCVGGPVGWAKPKLAHRAVGRGGVAQKCAFQCSALCAQCVLDGQALSSEQAEQVVKSISDLFGGVLADRVQQPSIG
jgi:hypothetical protein